MEGSGRSFGHFLQSLAQERIRGNASSHTKSFASSPFQGQSGFSDETVDNCLLKAGG